MSSAVPSRRSINEALHTIGYTVDEMTGHGFRTVASTLLNEDGHGDRMPSTGSCLTKRMMRCAARTTPLNTSPSAAG